MIEITDKRFSNTTLVGDLKAGDAFMSESKLYIVCSQRTDDSRVDAMCLANPYYGKIMSFMSTNMVTQVALHIEILNL